MHRPRGFTLIELLVAVAIIGLLSTMALIAFSTARVRARDARRAADIRTIQTALEIFRGHEEGYPGDTVSGAGGGSVGAGNLKSLVSGGWQASVPVGAKVFISSASADPGVPGAGHAYLYTSTYGNDSACDSTPCDTYALQFDVEQGIGSYGAGTYCATPPATISAGAC